MRTHDGQSGGYRPSRRYTRPLHGRDDLQSAAWAPWLKGHTGGKRIGWREHPAARCASGSRPAVTAAFGGRSHAGRRPDRASRLDHRTDGAPMGIGQPPVAAPGPSGGFGAPIRSVRGRARIHAPVGWGSSLAAWPGACLCSCNDDRRRVGEVSEAHPCRSPVRVYRGRFHHRRLRSQAHVLDRAARTVA